MKQTCFFLRHAVCDLRDDAEQVKHHAQCYIVLKMPVRQPVPGARDEPPSATTDAAQQMIRSEKWFGSKRRSARRPNEVGQRLTELACHLHTQSNKKYRLPREPRLYSCSDSHKMAPKIYILLETRETQVPKKHNTYGNRTYLLWRSQTADFKERSQLDVYKND